MSKFLLVINIKQFLVFSIRKVYKKRKSPVSPLSSPCCHQSPLQREPPLCSSKTSPFFSGRKVRSLLCSEHSSDFPSS